jgi:hypothetical protein
LREDVQTLAALSEGKRVIIQEGQIRLKPKHGFWHLDWFRGRARLGTVFHEIRRRLELEGLDSAGLGEERLIEDMSTLRAQVRRMMRHFNRKHGFFYRLFFDQEVDVAYDQLMQQIDYLLARLAKRELDALQEHVCTEAERMREQVRRRWQEKRAVIETKIQQVAERMQKQNHVSDRAVERFLAWKDDPGVQEVEALWQRLWENIEHALSEGELLGRLIQEETGGDFDASDALCVNHHNEVISKLVTWEGVVKEERKQIRAALDAWNGARNRLLERLEGQFEALKDVHERRELALALQKLKDLYLQRERAYLSFMEDAQRGLATISDDLQDGIRRLSRVLTTDEYLDARVAA